MKTGLSRRRGFSLIETSTMVVIGGIVASGCAIVLRQSYLVQRNSLRIVSTMRTLDLLRYRWTEDVRVATQAIVGDSLELQFNSASSVRYKVEGKKIERQKHEAGVVTARDDWSFSDPVSVVWTVDDSGRMPLVSMRVSNGSDTSSQSVWTFSGRLSEKKAVPQVTRESNE